MGAPNVCARFAGKWGWGVGHPLHVGPSPPPAQVAHHPSAVLCAPTVCSSSHFLSKGVIGVAHTPFFFAPTPFSVTPGSMCPHVANGEHMERGGGLHR